MKADRRLYLDATRSRVVEEGDPAAAILYAAVGDEIDAAEAKRYGLKEHKAVLGAPEDKSEADDGLERLSRAELDEVAERAGIDPAGLANKQAVIDAIREVP